MFPENWTPWESALIAGRGRSSSRSLSCAHYFVHFGLHANSTHCVHPLLFSHSCLCAVLAADGGGGARIGAQRRPGARDHGQLRRHCPPQPHVPRRRHPTVLDPSADCVSMSLRVHRLQPASTAASQLQIALRGPVVKLSCRPLPHLALCVVRSTTSLEASLIGKTNDELPQRTGPPPSSRHPMTAHPLPSRRDPHLWATFPVATDHRFGSPHQ